jgi:hypothetical protein
MPEGVSHEGVFGEVAFERTALIKHAAPPLGFAGRFPAPAAPRREMLADAASNRPKIDPALRAVRTGIVTVQIALTEASEANLEQLKKLGFQLVLRPNQGRLVIGRMDVSRLEELARLPFVRYVGKASIQGRP